MPTYYQDQHIIHDDGYGPVHRRYVISDTWAGLFQSGIEVKDLLFPEKIEEKYEDEDNSLVVDEMNLSVSDFDLGLNESYCLNMILASINPETKVYIGLFDSNRNSYNDGDLRFVGVILPERDESDTSWKRGDWATDRRQSVDYRFKVMPFAEEIMERFSLKDLIYGNDAENIVGIDQAWEQSFVEDKLGFVDNTGLSNAEEKVLVKDLVSYDKIIRKLADNLVQTITNKSLGNFNIVFNDCKLDGKLMPTYFKYFGDTISWPLPIYPRLRSTAYQGTLYEYEDDTTFITPFDSKLQEVYISPDLETAEENQIWVDYKNFKTRYPNEAPENPLNANYVPDLPDEIPVSTYPLGSSSDESFSIPDTVDNFNSFLYKTARAFNLYIKISVTGNATSADININFYPYSQIGTSKIYIKNATESTNQINQASGNSFKGVANQLLKSGIAFSDFKNESGVDWDVNLVNKHQENADDVLIFTLAPSLAVIERFEYEKSLFQNDLCFPHNHILTEYGSQVNTSKMHKGIFIKTTKGTTSQTEPESYWTPVQQIHINIDDQNHSFNTLEDYINYIQGRKAGFASLSKKVSIPFANGVSENSDGSNPSWKHLQIGKVIEFEGIGFVINKITSYLNENKVDLELNRFIEYSKIVDPLVPNYGKKSNSTQGDPVEPRLTLGKTYFPLIGFRTSELAPVDLYTDGDFTLNYLRNFNLHNVDDELRHQTWGVVNHSSDYVYLLQYDVKNRLLIRADTFFPLPTRITNHVQLRHFDALFNQKDETIHALFASWGGTRNDLAEGANYARVTNYISNFRQFNHPTGGHLETISGTNTLKLEPGESVILINEISGLTGTGFTVRIVGTLNITELAKWRKI